MSYSAIPAALRRFDAKPSAQVPEAVPRQLVWACLGHLVHLAGLLDLRDDLEWFAGRQGEGDLTGRDADGSVRVHVELKSATAAASYGSRCPRCTEYRSQLAHMGEDPEAVIVLLCQASRATRVWEMVAEAGVPLTQVRLITFAELADAVQEALDLGDLPGHDLLAALLDVEFEDDGDEAA